MWLKHAVSMDTIYLCHRCSVTKSKRKKKRLFNRLLKIISGNQSYRLGNTKELFLIEMHHLSGLDLQLWWRLLPSYDLISWQVKGTGNFFFFFFKIISSMFWSRIFKDVIEFQTRRWTTRLNSRFLIRVLSTLQALTTFSRMRLFLYFLEKKNPYFENFGYEFKNAGFKI